MAKSAGSNEFSALVDTELTSLGINTKAEVDDFRRNPRRAQTNATDMNTVITNIQTTRTQYWVSRKRMRHDALKLFNASQL